MLQHTEISVETAYSPNTAGLRCSHTQTLAINNGHRDMRSDTCEFLHGGQTKSPSLQKARENQARVAGPAFLVLCNVCHVDQGCATNYGWFGGLGEWFSENP